MKPDPEVWEQVLALAAEKVPAPLFETWLRPSALVGCDPTTCEVIVPNELFRNMLVKNFAQVLQTAVTEVLGPGPKLRVSVQPPPHPDASPPLPVVRAASLQALSSGHQWLIEDLWTAEAVGIIGGPPKAYKSWLALDMAVSVASGSPCLGVFPVPSPGPVLLYAGEDSPSSLRFRLESLARSRRLDLADLEVFVITSPSLRLDRVEDQHRFQATLTHHRPKLVVIDPLVRVHAADENAAGPIAALLGYFRALQRHSGAAVALVHHARKNSSGRLGYSLRGSSDFYAWTDCLLYLDSRRNQRRLLVQHRCAPASGPFPVELAAPSDSDFGPCLRLHQTQKRDPAASPQEDPLNRQILDLLAAASTPLSADTIRSRLRSRKQRVLAALRHLSQQHGPLLRLAQGYALKSQP